jgi:hypothetical protein
VWLALICHLPLEIFPSMPHPAPSFGMFVVFVVSLCIVMNVKGIESTKIFGRKDRDW